MLLLMSFLLKGEREVRREERDVTRLVPPEGEMKEQVVSQCDIAKMKDEEND